MGKGVDGPKEENKTLEKPELLSETMSIIWWSDPLVA